MNSATIVNSALLLEGLLAGTFVGATMMEHAARKLTAAHWIAYSRAKEAVYGPVMPVFFGGTLLASIAAAVAGAGRAPLVAAAVALAVVGAITVRVHLPLNAAFRTWSASEPPEAWAAMRRRWRDWNVVRCALAVFAFAICITG